MICTSCEKEISKMKLKGVFLVMGEKICNNCYININEDELVQRHAVKRSRMPVGVRKWLGDYPA